MKSFYDKFWRNLLKITLKLHSFTYYLSGKIAIKLEENDLHPKHRLMNYHQFFINNINENSSVLDIGCGNGALTYDVASKAKNIVGIDIDCQNIGIAKDKNSKRNISYICGDATKNLPKEKFDFILLSNVLEHIDNRINFLKSISVLAPVILIRVPMIERDWITLYKREIGVDYLLDNSHYIEYTLKGFKKEVNQANLTIKSYDIRFGEIWAVVGTNSHNI